MFIDRLGFSYSPSSSLGDFTIPLPTPLIPKPHSLGGSLPLSFALNLDIMRVLFRDAFSFLFFLAGLL